jgi:chemotaxis protein CheX
MGHACTKLAGLGYHIDISIPTLIVGKGSLISTLGIDRIVIPLETEVGVVQLNLALREKSSNSMP